MSLPNYGLLKSFQEPASCDSWVSKLDLFIDKFDSFLSRWHHISYPPDMNKQRDSYAFPVYLPEFTDGRRVLPGIVVEDPDFPEGFADLTNRVAEKLGITQGRVLFNIQRYKNNSPPVMPHFDGEYFQEHLITENELFVERGLRPHRTAVLTLLNITDGGGTCIFEGTRKVATLVGEKGDLATFDNVKYTHGVDELSCKDAVPKAAYVRYTIGWRSLDEGCYLIKHNVTENSVPYDEAVEMHRDFLANEWPRKRMKLLGQSGYY